MRMRMSTIDVGMRLPVGDAIDLRPGMEFGSVTLKINTRTCPATVTGAPVFVF